MIDWWVSVSAELRVIRLFLLLLFLSVLPCSAVDLIRLGGGRLRFLVAKSDLDVSEKISASSCWLPQRSDNEKTIDGRGPRQHAVNVYEWWEISSSTKTNHRSGEQTLCDSQIQTCSPRADITGCWHHREWSRLINQCLRWEIQKQPVCSAVCFKAQDVAFIYLLSVGDCAQFSLFLFVESFVFVIQPASNPLTSANNRRLF